MIDMLGFDTGCILVQPSNVLALAGLKGQNYLYSLITPPDSFSKIDKMNELLESQGVKLTVKNTSQESNVSGGVLDSLRGYDIKSHNSKKILPSIGVSPFSMSDGFGIFSEWDNQLGERVEQGMKEN
jgi:hypothetical protein